MPTFITSVVGSLVTHAAVGQEIAAAVDPVPLRHRKFEQVDVLAGDDVLLAGALLDDARRDAAFDDVAADLDELARMGVGRQAHHHGDAAIAAEPAGEHRAAAGGVLVVVLDVVEQQRRAGARALGDARDGAELDVPIDLGVDLVQFAGRLQRLHPVAHIAEGDRLAFGGHHFSFTAKRSAGGAISVTRSRTSFLFGSGATVISRGSSRAVQA